MNELFSPAALASQVLLKVSPGFRGDVKLGKYGRPFVGLLSEENVVCESEVTWLLYPINLTTKVLDELVSGNFSGI